MRGVPQLRTTTLPSSPAPTGTPNPESVPSPVRMAVADDAAFRALFSGSPVKRIGRDRFVRNVLVAIGNSADPALRAEEEEAEAADTNPAPLGLDINLDLTPTDPPEPSRGCTPSQRYSGQGRR